MKALQQSTYNLVGEMLVTIVAQGGPEPAVLDETATRYMVQMQLGESEALYTDLPDNEASSIESVNGISIVVLLFTAEF